MLRRHIKDLIIFGHNSIVLIMGLWH